MKVYFSRTLGGEAVETKISTELNIKLSKKQEKQLRQMREHRSGSIPIEIFDPYKEFKAKIKEQIKRGTNFTRIKKHDCDKLHR